MTPQELAHDCFAAVADVLDREGIAPDAPIFWEILVTMMCGHYLMRNGGLSRRAIYVTDVAKALAEAESRWEARPR